MRIWLGVLLQESIGNYYDCRLTLQPAEVTFDQ
jgi:hypothetical protein